ncbi:FXSXX-COOH protein [Streptomyces sp. NPDC006476]
MAVELDKLPEKAVEQALARVLRDTLDCRTQKVPMFDSSL